MGRLESGWEYKVFELIGDYGVCGWVIVFSCFLKLVLGLGDGYVYRYGLSLVRRMSLKVSRVRRLIFVEVGLFWREE